MKNVLLQMKLVAIILFCYPIISIAQQNDYTPNDFFHTVSISEPAVSPNGEWIAYTLTTIDSTEDYSTSDIWMVDRNGLNNIQLTYTPQEDETTPKWSPDGQWLSFLSDRYADEVGSDLSQLWMMRVLGGEAKTVTTFTMAIENYHWMPDSKKILFELTDEDFSDTAASGHRSPYVINRYLFKTDGGGYADSLRTHLYLYTIDTDKLDTITSGHYNESDVAISPNGKQIAFVSNRNGDEDRSENTDIYIMDLKPDAVPILVSNSTGTEHSPQWSQDGKRLAWLQSTSTRKFTMYGHDMICYKDFSTPGKINVVYDDLPVAQFGWQPNNQAFLFLRENDREQQIISIPTVNPTPTTIAAGQRAFYELVYNKTYSEWITIQQTPDNPGELYRLDATGILKKLTSHQDEFMKQRRAVKVIPFTSKSADGNTVSSILYCREDLVNTKKMPLIMHIHGGPVGQDDYGFDLQRNILASAGYLVCAVNYRGSSGRGTDYITAIDADWGHKEVLDILGAANELIKTGMADENRMGIGGWSYGGILTNYTIATDQRFKAAASGAGSSLQLTMYGTDQYVIQYEDELGYPWKNTDKWLSLSYPFFKADQIKTPTLFMAAEKDFNVPVAGAEQMYQALRTQGVPTELVIYPGQHHGLTIPSYKADRFQRYLDWFGKYLK